MSSYNRGRNAGLIAPSILAAIAWGCGKEPEPSNRMETASSPAAVTVDTAPAQTDTLAVSLSTESSTASPAKGHSDTVVKSVRARARVRPARAALAEAADSQYLKYDAATNTVTFELIGGPRGFQFNNYANGGATLTLPSKANVVMNFINKDGTPHSAQVISGEGPLPTAAVETAIPRAYTRQLTQGLAQEATDVLQFQVPETGRYRIFCGVPGHGLGGMWIWMVVDPAAKAPSFGPTKS
jgi:plastocyanin